MTRARGESVLLSQHSEHGVGENSRSGKIRVFLHVPHANMEENRR